MLKCAHQEIASMATDKILLTADDLMHLPDDGMRHELVKGILTSRPYAGGQAGITGGHLSAMISEHVHRNRLGHALAGGTGFQLECEPDTIRAASVAFIAHARFSSSKLPVDYPQLAPDLVAEVISPWDRWEEIEEKVHDWLRAGVRLVWVVQPSTSSVTVYRSLRDVHLLTQQDALDGFDVLPGFTCPVRALFPY
jgi:Uma2 family endonuclease